MSYFIAVRLQEKRRVKITEEGNFLPKTKVERQLVQSYRGQLLAAGSNILPLLISVIFAVERLYTDNPYVKNVTLVNMAAVTFGIQLFRMLMLVFEHIPDVQREVLHVSSSNFLRKVSEISGISAVHLVALAPTAVVMMWWNCNSNWVAKDILSMANTIMLIVDLSKLTTLRQAFALTVCATLFSVFSGEHINNFIYGLERTELPLIFSVPLNFGGISTSLLSLRTCDIILPGIMISFFRRFDATRGLSVAKNTGDEVVIVRSPSLVLPSIVGSSVGIMIGLFLGFGVTSHLSVITYSSIGAIVTPTIAAALQGRLSSLYQFKATADPFKMC